MFGGVTVTAPSCSQGRPVPAAEGADGDMFRRGARQKKHPNTESLPRSKIIKKQPPGGEGGGFCMFLPGVNFLEAFSCDFSGA